MFLQDSDEPTFYSLCGVLKLQEGILVSHNFSTPVRYILGAEFQPTCFQHSIPMIDTNMDLILNEFSEQLPIVRSSWEEYTQRSGSFVKGVVPVLYSISFLAVVTWFLTVFVIANLKKSSSFLQGSTAFALIYMVIIVVKSLITLHDQQRNGYFNGQILLAEVTTTNWIRAIDLVVILLLQLNQVQVIMRLFSRQSDKRLVFLAGVFATVASQVIWGVTEFGAFPSSKEVERVLSALTYLVRIANNVIYATIFTAFLLTKLRTILANRSIWLISILSLMFIYAPIAFFVADVTSPWAHEFPTVTYTVCVVLPWQWCNSYDHIQKIQEKEGILGRKFYEDELCELDRLGLFVEEEDECLGLKHDEDDDNKDDDDDDDDGVTASLVSLENSNSRNGLGSSGRKAGRSSLSQLQLIKTLFNAESIASASNTRGNVVHSTKFRIAFASLEHENDKYKLSMRPRTGLETRLSNFKDKFWSATDKVIETGLEIPRPGSKNSRSQTPTFQFERDSIFEDDHNSLSIFKRRHHEETTRPYSGHDANPPGQNRDVFVYKTKNMVFNPDD